MARAALYTGLCFVTATTCHRKSRKLLKPAHPREVGSSIRRARTSPAHVLKKINTVTRFPSSSFPSPTTHAPSCYVHGSALRRF